MIVLAMLVIITTTHMNNRWISYSPLQKKRRKPIPWRHTSAAFPLDVNSTDVVVPIVLSTTCRGAEVTDTGTQQTLARRQHRGQSCKRTRCQHFQRTSLINSKATYSQWMRQTTKSTNNDAHKMNLCLNLSVFVPRPCSIGMVEANNQTNGNRD